MATEIIRDAEIVVESSNDDLLTLSADGNTITLGRDARVEVLANGGLGVRRGYDMQSVRYVARCGVWTTSDGVAVAVGESIRAWLGLDDEPEGDRWRTQFRACARAWLGVDDEPEVNDEPEGETAS